MRILKFKEYLKEIASQTAADLGGSAHKLSKLAQTSPRQHDAASEAHDNAAAAYRKEGNEEKAEEHDRAAQYHASKSSL
jgi:hypothetical protein